MNLITHSIRHRLDHNSHATLLSLDCSNAFNCIKKEKVLDAVNEKVPALMGLAAWAYGSPSTLTWNGNSVTSSSGTKQGCPIGGNLFCLGLQDVLEEVQQTWLAIALVAYMDDIPMM
eukprot:gb/GECG01011046.1/.p1 GENE.gb/GECG01011046.1/~~gb/GECG01011046.1/.p1  ORF type:complete len:117 (+),score=9.41 gb/GECG01011046.1/:1-351(+)